MSSYLRKSHPLGHKPKKIKHLTLYDRLFREPKSTQTRRHIRELTRGEAEWKTRKVHLPEDKL